MRFVARQAEDPISGSAAISRDGSSSDVISGSRYDEWHSTHCEANTRSIAPVYRVSLRRSMLVYRLPDAAF